MGPVTASVTVDVPRDEAFRFVADLANRPAFTDHFIEDFRLTRLDSTGIGAAARYRIDPPVGATWVETVVDRLEPPHRILESGSLGRSGRVPAVTMFEFVARGEVTEISVCFWTEPRHPVDLVKERLGWSRWHRRRWARAMNQLRELLEGPAGESERVGVAGGNRHPTGVL